MIGASKILTVSYGTFSCTLEGFDDPFNTMRAIAEYFRDLAADDRYFGAEPPTPDAAMLHKIAEREIQRRVEAKISDGGVVLTAAQAPPPRVTMPAVHPSAMPTPAPVMTPGLAPSVVSVAAAAPAVESAAARLSRLRAAQSQILAQIPAPAAIAAPVLADISSRFADVEAYAEDQDAAATFTPAPIKLPTVPVQTPVQTVVAEPVAAQAAVAAPEIIAPEFIAPQVAAPEAVAGDLLPDLEPPDFEPTDREPTAAEPVLDNLRETLAGLIAQDDQLAEDMANAAEPAAALVASDAFADNDDALPEDDAWAGDDAWTGDDAEIGDDAQIADLPEADAFDAPDEDIDQSDLDDLSALDAPTSFDPTPLIDDAAYLDDAAAPIDAPVLIVQETVVEAVKMPAIEASPDAPIVVEKIHSARARVIKIRRLDKKPDASAESLAAAVTDPLPALVLADPVPATLSPEAEADLLNTLAALEAEIVPVTAEPAPVVATLSLQAHPDDALVIGAVTQAGVTALAVAAPVVEKASDSMLAADDAAVDRLMAQTNSQLEVPETKRRRSAIAHLKAAVQATVADRMNTAKSRVDVAEVKMDPYRKDLDQAVRPVTAPLHGERPAPLVLVSAQRIDRKRDAVADANRPVPQIVSSGPAPVSQPGTVMPVRPRRVSAGGLAQAVSTQSVDDEDSDPKPAVPGNIFADGARQSFAEFAESLGAATMVELIEAAGAYCTLVLDRPSFTRPLLFQQISSLPHLAEPNREDSLRWFGKLLRDGRIQKTVRGQFALSDTSPILTEAKRIAG